VSAVGRGVRARALRRPVVALLPLLVLFVAVTLVATEAGVRPADEGSYIGIAENLTQGRYSDPNHPSLWFGPGLPSVLTPLVAVDAPKTVLRLTGPLFLFLAAVFFYGLLRRYVSSRIALFGAYAFGLYFPFYTLLPTVHSEPLAIFLVIACLYFMAEFIHSGRWLALVAAGFALGWLALTRVVFGWVVTLVLILFAAVWLVERLRRREGPGQLELISRRTVAVAAIALVACTPWLAFTYSESGRLWYWGNSGGLSLYWMSSPFPGEHGSWFNVDDVTRKPELARHRPFFASIRGEDSYEADAALQRQAREYIRSSPDEYIENVLANVSRMWFSMPYSYTEQKLSTLFYAVPNALLLGGTVLAVAILILARPHLPAEFLPFGALATVAFGLSALVAAYSRMLFPIVPILMIVIVYALTNHVRVVSTRRAPSRDGQASPYS
jgi:Dolichyl-phosphate-mannose-protein mannosyltransferase